MSVKLLYNATSSRAGCLAYNSLPFPVNVSFSVRTSSGTTPLGIEECGPQGYCLSSFTSVPEGPALCTAEVEGLKISAEYLEKIPPSYSLFSVPMPSPSEEKEAPKPELLSFAVPLCPGRLRITAPIGSTALVYEKTPSGYYISQRLSFSESSEKTVSVKNGRYLIHVRKEGFKPAEYYVEVNCKGTKNASTAPAETMPEGNATFANTEHGGQKEEGNVSTPFEKQKYVEAELKNYSSGESDLAPAYSETPKSEQSKSTEKEFDLIPLLFIVLGGAGLFALAKTLRRPQSGKRRYKFRRR